MQRPETTRELLQQLADPSRSSQALFALMLKGNEGIHALAEFLLTSKPSSLPEARLLAVEGLATLKGPEALTALVCVARERLEEITDPIIRLAEETVASRAAEALGDFADPRAREALLELVKGKPLIGVAEAFAKAWDVRAVPYLVSWLGDDFVAEAAGRALRHGGSSAFSTLVDSLLDEQARRENEPGISQRRRARILEILDDLIGSAELYLIEDLLNDPVEMVRLNSARILLNKGSAAQQSCAFQTALLLLDSTERAVRGLSEEILLEHFAMGHSLIEQEIQRREDSGELAEQFFPRETTLRILLRIRSKGKKIMEAHP